MRININFLKASTELIRCINNKFNEEITNMMDDFNSETHMGILSNVFQINFTKDNAMN